MSETAALKHRTAWLSIFSNTTLVILKLIVGLYVGAVSLISEALHSGGTGQTAKKWPLCRTAAAP